MVGAFVVGLIAGFGVAFVLLTLTTTLADFRKAGEALRRRSQLPKGVRRTTRPDVRRIVLRPVNIDQPSSRITQAVFRQNPVRKLRDEADPRDID